LPAHALAVLTLSWSDVTCGLIGTDGTRTEQPCDAAYGGRSFSAIVNSGESVFVSANLHYEYSDDGLALDPNGNWAFPRLGPGPFPRQTHESAALYFYSNQCASYWECLGRPTWEIVDDFNRTSDPLILHNEMPDHLSGDLLLFASSGVVATWPHPRQRTAFVDARGFTVDARGVGGAVFVPAIPEPATWALMFVGLAALGLARRTHNG
jgi:hypothetical protein